MTASRDEKEVPEEMSGRRHAGWPEEAPISVKATKRKTKVSHEVGQPHWIPSGRSSVQRGNQRKGEASGGAILSRKAAREIASGISFRKDDLSPGARCIELSKVCDFYEAKASGTYIDSPLCGRYLRSMAKEVRALSLALREGENSRRRRIRELETVCEEWDEFFGPENLNKAGMQPGLLDKAVPWTPAAVYRETQRVAKRNQALEAALAEEAAARAMTAINAQHQLEDHRRASREYAARQRAAFQAQLEAQKVTVDTKLANLAANAALVTEREQSEARIAQKQQVEEQTEKIYQMENNNASTQNLLESTQLALQKESERADTAEAALRKAAFELSHVREMRRAAIDEALLNETKLRLARQVDNGQQCPDFGVGMISFSALPRAGINNNKVYVHGVPPTTSLAQLNAMLQSRLGIAFTAAQPRRATNIDGAKSFELTLPLPRDVQTLLELPGATLPPDENDLLLHTDKIITPSTHHNPRDASLGTRTSHRTVSNAHQTRPTSMTYTATSRREPLRAVAPPALNIIPATDHDFDSQPSTTKFLGNAWAPTPPKITPPPAYTENPDAVLDRLSALRPVFRTAN